MLRNTKKYVPIFTVAALLSGNGLSSNTLQVAAIRGRMDMELDSFFDDDSFFSDNKKKGRGGFGFDDDSFFNSDSNFMQDDFMGGDDGNTQFVSSSSSTSYSTVTGPDGQVHQQASQQGEQKVCVNGQCKSVKYSKGSDPNKNKNRGSELPDPHGEFQIKKHGEKDRNQRQQKQQNKQKRNDRFGHMNDDFADMNARMNERMKKMDEDFMKMDNSFADIEMPKMNMNAGGSGKAGDPNVRTQTFSSQTVKTSTTGPDGKVHTTEQKGAAMHCQDGNCKSASTQCKDGNCEQVIIDHSDDAAFKKKNNGKLLPETEAKSGSKEVPSGKAEQKTDQSTAQADDGEADDL